MIDLAFEGVEEGAQIERQDKLQSKRAQMEGIVGSPMYLFRVAKDIVEHC